MKDKTIKKDRAAKERVVVEDPQLSTTYSYAGNAAELLHRAPSCESVDTEIEDNSLNNLISKIDNMADSEIKESQKQWWQEQYSKDAIINRIKIAEKQIEEGDMSAWLTEDQAKVELRRRLPWLK